MNEKITSTENFEDLLSLEISNSVQMNNQTVNTKILDNDEETCDFVGKTELITFYEFSIIQPFASLNFCLSVEFDDNSK